MVGAQRLAKGLLEMTQEGVYSHASLFLTALTVVLLSQFSLIFLVFLYLVWSKQTANAGILRVGLWVVAHHVIIDNYKNLTVA